jgi:ABC-type polysaccharide/polyol phosphate export permease
MQLLRGNRSFRWLWSGQVVSELGNWFNFIAGLGLIRSVSAAAPEATAVMLVALLALNFALLPRVRGTEWLALPLALAVVGFTCGLALAISSLNVLYRDIEFLVAALLLPLFFLTPVLYPLSDPKIAHRHHVGEVIHWVNPLSPMVEALRDPLFYGRLPRAGDVIYTVAAALLALAFGAWVFTRVDDQIAVEV